MSRGVHDDPPAPGTPATLTPDTESDPMEPLDLVDALFKAAQAAIVAGDERVEVTPECHEMAAALRTMYQEGQEGLPRVRALAQQFQASVPRAMGAHDDCLDELGDAMLAETGTVPAYLNDLDTARIMRMSRSALLRVVDWYLAMIDDSRRPEVWPATVAGLSDEQLRVAVRQLGRCAPILESRGLLGKPTTGS